MGAVNLVTLMDRYNSGDRCRDYLEHLRWPAGVACIRCGDTEVDEIESRNQWQCRSCDYQFSVTAGTIMHRSHLPLRKWFIAIYLMCESKKGMSANQLKRTLGVQYRTAWFLCHRIREAMGNDPFTGPTLFGIGEVDETMIGAGRRARTGATARHGSPVLSSMAAASESSASRTSRSGQSMTSCAATCATRPRQSTLTS